jgi:hypothetical protein
MSRVQEKIYRLAYIGGIAAFFLPVFEPFLPLMFTIAGALVLGSFVKFLFRVIVNKKFNRTYRAYNNSSNTGASYNAQEGKRTGANIPPRPEDPFEAYRALLDLPAGFTRAQLKKAYRTKAAQYHPDRYGSEPVRKQQNAEEMMKKINDAYNVLKKQFTLSVYV